MTTKEISTKALQEGLKGNFNDEDLFYLFEISNNITLLSKFLKLLLTEANLKNKIEEIKEKIKDVENNATMDLKKENPKIPLYEIQAKTSEFTAIYYKQILEIKQQLNKIEAYKKFFYFVKGGNF